MSAPNTGDEFLDLVRKSGLVDGERLAAWLKKKRDAASLPEPRSLAELLIREGLLTTYQAEKLWHGRWRCFSVGEYRILEHIATGTMGVVYLCEEQRQRRLVALKMLPLSSAPDPTARQRFAREARATAAVAHPNVVAIYGLGEHDGLSYITLEYIDGSNLQHIVERSGPLEPARAAHYIAEVAAGLQGVHAQGLIHRDIEPGNILVNRQGRVKIIDFGLARAIDDGYAAEFMTEYVEKGYGTADYLAPDVAAGRAMHTAGIYSLGATFYFCLTGQPPFGERGTVAHKLVWHQNCRPTPVRSLRPEVPSSLVAVIDRMLANDPGERFPGVAAVAQALEPWQRQSIAPPTADEMPHYCPLVQRLINPACESVWRRLLRGLHR